MARLLSVQWNQTGCGVARIYEGVKVQWHQPIPNGCFSGKLSGTFPKCHARNPKSYSQVGRCRATAFARRLQRRSSSVVRCSDGETVASTPTSADVAGPGDSANEKNPIILIANDASNSVTRPSSPATLGEETEALQKAGLELATSLEEAETEALKVILEPEADQQRSPGLDADELAPLYDPSTDTAFLLGPETGAPIAPQVVARLVTANVAEHIPLRDERDVSAAPHAQVAASKGVSEKGSQPLPTVTTNSLPELEVMEPTMWDQLRMIAGFVGPALGIWLANPLMSLIDTAVIGNGSSLELAALGPGTVLCDQLSYLFMFLSVATSNLIAMSLAQKKKEEAADHLARLLFVAGTGGVVMIFLIRFIADPILLKFVGSNVSLIPAAKSYAFIRGWAWPAVLVMSVAQSASLGMQDAWSPLGVLAISSFINLVGDCILCPVLGFGIAGAAWATTFSQYVGCFLMLLALKRNAVLPLSIKVPTARELLFFIRLAGPILLIMLAKTSFYTILTYVATSMGAVALAAHQVAIGLFALCAVCGEPLSQTAQSYLPELTAGISPNLKKARSLLKSLLILGFIIGMVMGSAAGAVPWLCPGLFTKDPLIIAQLRLLSLPIHVSLLLTPIVLSLEGTLLAGRDLAFLAASMAASLAGCVVLIIIGQTFELGIVANWWTLVAFQFVRMANAALRLNSSSSILADRPVASGMNAQLS